MGETILTETSVDDLIPNSLASRGASTFTSATNGTNGQAGTIARPRSRSIVATIALTPVSLPGCALLL
jgi:hypothetical protein